MTSRAPEIASIKLRFEMLAGRLNESQLREFAAVEAKVFGLGGVRAVSRATGLAINTVRRGLKDLEKPACLGAPQRVRRSGGGRKKLRDSDSGLVATREQLVDPFSRGDARVFTQAVSGGLNFQF